MYMILKQQEGLGNRHQMKYRRNKGDCLMDPIELVGKMVSKNCNGDWEHSYGIKIETLDNPGWSVEIDLADTNLELRYFEVVKIQRSESNWIVCQIEDDIFKGGWPRKSNRNTGHIQ